MKISHQQYLENVLRSVKLELKEAEIQHRVNCATYEEKRKLLQQQIESIERQLKDN